MTTSATHRYQRPWLIATWVAAFGALPLVTGGYGALYALALWGDRTRNYVGFGFAVAWAAVGVLAGTRSAMVAVIITPDRLIVRNFFRTHRIPWPDILDFDRPRPFKHMGQYSGWYNRKNGIRVRLRSGDLVVAFMYSPAGWDPPEFADDVIGALRRSHNAAIVPAPASVTHSRPRRTARPIARRRQHRR